MRPVVVPRGVAGGSLSVRAYVRAAIALVALHAVPAAAQPQIPFKSRELEEGKNFVQRLTTSLSVGESTGSLSTAYPIAIPPGRGVTPRIELQYSSSGGASEYGFGWELTIPMIERVTESGGAPMLLTSDRYRFRNGHETAELEDSGTVIDGWKVYKERVEKSFNRFLLQNDTWRILTPSGLRYELGTSSGSRRTSPFFQISAAWLVSRIIDPHSNFAQYTYSPDPVGEPRIASIQYNGNEVTGLSPGLRVDFKWTAGAFRRGFSWKPGYKRVWGFEHLSARRLTERARTRRRFRSARRPRVSTRWSTRLQPARR
jgi:hypothetical protein